MTFFPGGNSNCLIRLLSDFTLTVDRVNKDSFSGYTFGEFVLFDDVSSFTKWSIINFKLTRTNNGVKSCKFRYLRWISINVQNILVFVNDVPRFW